MLNDIYTILVQHNMVFEDSWDWFCGYWEVFLTRKVSVEYVYS